MSLSVARLARTPTGPQLHAVPSEQFVPTVAEPEFKLFVSAIPETRQSGLRTALYAAVAGLGGLAALAGGHGASSIPVVDQANKPAAVSQYLGLKIGDRATFSADGNAATVAGDRAFVQANLEKLSPGQLNLLFQEGTTFHVDGAETLNRMAASRDADLQDYATNPNVLGIAGHIHNDRGTDVDIKQSYVDSHPGYSASKVFLHETSHGMDSAAARALGLSDKYYSDGVAREAEAGATPAQLASENYAVHYRDGADAGLQQRKRAELEAQLSAHPTLANFDRMSSQANAWSWNTMAREDATGKGYEDGGYAGTSAVEWLAEAGSVRELSGSRDAIGRDHAAEMARQDPGSWQIAGGYLAQFDHLGAELVTARQHPSPVGEIKKLVDPRSGHEFQPGEQSLLGIYPSNVTGALQADLDNVRHQLDLHHH